METDKEKEKDFKIIAFSTDEIVLYTKGVERVRITKDGKFIALGQEIEDVNEIYAAFTEMMLEWHRRR